ncbi:unnamed protein product, partial [Discosporangium mesarthrocarpum]
ASTSTPQICNHNAKPHKSKCHARLPDDLQAFLSSSDGFSLSWAAAIYGNRETRVGHLRVNQLSGIARMPLDADDLRSLSSHPLEGTCSFSADGGGAVSSHISAPVGRGEGGKGYSTVRPSQERGRFSVAAFALDSDPEVGSVTLVYRTPTTAQSRRLRTGKGGGDVAEGLAKPEVWLQDLACGWHYMTGSFSSYFRMMVVHLGVLGWQHAYTPMGLSPATQQWMRLYCPDRLLFDQLEWEKEKGREKDREKTTEREEGHKLDDTNEEEEERAAATPLPSRAEDHSPPRPVDTSDGNAPVGGRETSEVGGLAGEKHMPSSGEGPGGCGLEDTAGAAVRAGAGVGALAGA